METGMAQSVIIGIPLLMFFSHPVPCMLPLSQDLEHIEAGHYKLPWDMTTVNHRQFNPLFMLRR